MPLPVRKPQDAENERAVQARRQCDRYDDASTEWLLAASRSLYGVQYRGGFSGIDNDAAAIVVNQNPDVIVLKRWNTDKIHTLPLRAWRVF